MFEFALGIFFGVAISILYFVFDSNIDIDHNFTVSVIIAFATIIATAIHFDSVRKQRKDRIWEINKDSLLELAKSLSDAIEISSKFSDREFNNMQGIPDDTSTEGAKEINDKFRETISDSLNVYKPLLNAELISAIEIYQSAEKDIEEQFVCDAINTFEAYDRQWGKQKELQTAVSGFIKDASGI